MMATLELEIVTAEQQIYSGDASAVVADGIEGQLGILPHHAPLITMLKPGELLIRKDREETYMAITGGFLEVRPDKVIILADACERCDDIDLERAEAAKHRAEERLKTHIPGIDLQRAEAALRRSMIRIKVAEKRRRKTLPQYK